MMATRGVSQTTRFTVLLCVAAANAAQLLGQSIQEPSFSHSTITVDGADEWTSKRGQIAGPADDTWEQGERYTFCASHYSFKPAKDVDWERRVIAVDKSYWLLQDLLTGREKRPQIEQAFHFDAKTTIQLDGRTTIAAEPSGAKLVIVPLSDHLKPHIAAGDEIPPRTYWPSGTAAPPLAVGPQTHGDGGVGRGQKRQRAGHAATYVGQVKLPAMLTVAIIPLSPGQKIEEIPRIRCHDTGKWATWRLPGPRCKLWFASHRKLERCAVIDATHEESLILADRGAFLRDLKLDRPELAQVKAALNRGDVDGAGAAYIAYFRKKTCPLALTKYWDDLKRNPHYRPTAAERFMAGHLNDGYLDYELPESGLDWRTVPLACLTRFPRLGAFLHAIYHTEEPKYLRFLVDHILGYMQAYPIDEFIGTNCQQGYQSPGRPCSPWYWCMLPDRLDPWAHMVVFIRNYAHVSDDELLGMLHRMYQEAAYLRTQLEPEIVKWGNSGAFPTRSMKKVCLLFEDFKASDEWETNNMRLLDMSINRNYYPDGVWPDLTLGYYSQIVSHTHATVDMCGPDRLSQTARDRLKATITASIGLSKPNGLLPSYGDRTGRHFSLAISKLAKRFEMKWVDTIVEQTDGPLPPFTVWPVPGQAQWCGYYTMRSDWTPQARYMAIDGGPWGKSHVHADKLSLIVCAHGTDFITDPGCTEYASNKSDAFISRMKPGFLHNTITVDEVDEWANGPSQITEPLDNTWEHGAHYSLFEGRYSFKPVKDVDWQRRVIFVDKSYWLLQDVLTGGQTRTQIEQNFQFRPEIEITFKDRLAVRQRSRPSRDGGIEPEVKARDRRRMRPFVEVSQRRDRAQDPVAAGQHFSGGLLTIATAPNRAGLVLMPLSGGLKPHLTIGDKAPHTTYWPSGKPVQHFSGWPNSHGRGWYANTSMHKPVPAPAVTYTGPVELPAVLTMAIVPLSPEQSIDDLPRISSETDRDGTTWVLPVANGQLMVKTSPRSCEVIRAGVGR